MKCSDCYWHEQCGADAPAMYCPDFTPVMEMDARDEQEYFEQLRTRCNEYESIISSLSEAEMCNYKSRNSAQRLYV